MYAVEDEIYTRAQKRRLPNIWISAYAVGGASARFLIEGWRDFIRTALYDPYVAHDENWSQGCWKGGRGSSVPFRPTTRVPPVPELP